jgi:hypothetical protein
MIKILFLLGFIVFLTSCEKIDNSTNGDYTEYIKDNSISTDIDFYPGEIYDNNNEVDSPLLKLFFKTTKSFPCINYGIAISKFIEGDKFILRFDSVVHSGICLTALGPASTYTNLPDNTKSLILINGNLIDSYQLDITDEKVEIKQFNSSFSNLKYSTVFRYPENTFVYECNMDTSETHFYSDFLKILTANLSIIEFNFDGEGLKPYAEDWMERNKKSLTKYFQYENETEFDKAGELLENFVIENNINKNTSVYISLISWNNNKHLSWMLSD